MDDIKKRHVARSEELRAHQRSLDGQKQELLQAAAQSKVEQQRIFSSLHDALHLREEQLRMDCDEVVRRFEIDLDAQISAVGAEYGDVQNKVESMRDMLDNARNALLLKHYARYKSLQLPEFHPEHHYRP